MFKKNETCDSMGNWRIYDDKGRMRAVIYSTELTERAIDKAEKLADATCLLFNSLKANATYMDNGTDKLLDDVMKLDNLSAIDLAKKLQLPIGHYYVPAGYHDNPTPLCLCMIHNKTINPPMTDMVEGFNAVYCIHCDSRVAIANIEEYEQANDENYESLAKCPCSTPLPDDDELCLDCRKAETEKVEKERDDYDNEGKEATMTLQELIEYLEKENPKQVVPLGFDNPHSYRGFYDQLAFEPACNVTIGSMLDCAKKSLGKTFEGYKGGDYFMEKYTDVWLARYGCLGEGIGPTLLDYMTGKIKSEVDNG